MTHCTLHSVHYTLHHTAADLNISIEVVPRYVQLHGSPLHLGVVKTPVRELRHPGQPCGGAGCTGVMVVEVVEKW